MKTRLRHRLPTPKFFSEFTAGEAALGGVLLRLPPHPVDRHKKNHVVTLLAEFRRYRVPETVLDAVAAEIRDQAEDGQLRQRPRDDVVRALVEVAWRMFCDVHEISCFQRELWREIWRIKDEVMAEAQAKPLPRRVVVGRSVVVGSARRRDKTTAHNRPAECFERAHLAPCPSAPQQTCALLRSPISQRVSGLPAGFSADIAPNPL